MKNQGFSLIELIAVIAIMAVALAVGGYSINAISLSRAKNCATEINSGLERTRTQSYTSDGGSAGIAKLEIYKKDNSVYLKKSFEGEEKKIGSGGITVTYMAKGDTSERTLGTDHLTFSFNKSSGAFQTTYVGSQAIGEIASIKITGGGRTYTITCYPKTGRTIME